MIIQATIQHAEVLTEVGAESFFKSHEGSAPTHELAAYTAKIYNVNAITQELGNPANIYHLITHNNVAAGYSKMELDISHPAIALNRVSKMDQIYLLHSFHGLKLGTKLLNHNIEYSKSRGENGMWLVVWIGNDTAISFYEKFGFHIVTQAEFQLTATHRSPCYIMLLQY
jgi:ribosomal protein S18 acetylase RimI-like enzyme